MISWFPRLALSLCGWKLPLWHGQKSLGSHCECGLPVDGVASTHSPERARARFQNPFAIPLQLRHPTNRATLLCSTIPPYWSAPICFREHRDLLPARPLLRRQRLCSLSHLASTPNHDSLCQVPFTQMMSRVTDKIPRTLNVSWNRACHFRSRLNGSIVDPICPPSRKQAAS
jgi:hypothetical protein